MRQVGGLHGGALLLVLAGLLCGCSPDLDWRELHSAEGRFRVLMPARPAMASGADASGNAQTLWTAQAGAALFSVGYTDYADAAGAHLAPVREALVRSARGKLVQDADARAPRSGRAFTIRGWAADGSDRILKVWLFPSGDRLYQLAVTGRPESAGVAEADTFVLSFKPD